MPLTGDCNANEIDARQNPLIAEHKLQRPSTQLHGHDYLSAEAEEKRHGHKGLYSHKPRGQQPLPDHKILLAEDMVAAVKWMVELIRGVPEVAEAVLPEPHVLEAGECFVVGLYPVRTKNQ